MSCPYCKTTEAWAFEGKRVVCLNCRNYAEAIKQQDREAAEQELFRQYGALPFDWQTRGIPLDWPRKRDNVAT